MVVGVIANGMAVLVKFLHPVHIFLLEDLADGEKMNHAAMRLHAARGLDGIIFRVGVQIALFVIPMGVFPMREVARHLQVESDGNERLLALRGAGFTGGELR